MNNRYICEDGGIRLDKFLSERESDLSRSAITRLIESGNCEVNRKKANKKQILKTGDEVELTIPQSKTVGILPENILIDIAYEDSDVIVINKARGMVVHPSHGHSTGTLVNALMYHCNDSLSGINGELRPGIVHRIDKNTSGLLIAAKNDFAHIKLAAQIEKHTLLREYEAVVMGAVKQDGSIDAPIGRHKTDRKKMCVTAENSKRAVTHYTVLGNYGNFTHLRLRLETGRTHQIRVHMAYMGHAVCGDDVYGNGKPKWLGGQCLHSKTMEFVHPVSGELLRIDSELPGYFTKMLREIEKT